MSTATVALRGLAGWQFEVDAQGHPLALAITAADKWRLSVPPGVAIVAAGGLLDRPVRIPLLGHELLVLELRPSADAQSVTASVSGSLVTGAYEVVQQAGEWPVFRGAGGDLKVAVFAGGHALSLRGTTPASVPLLPGHAELSAMAQVELSVVFTATEVRLVAHPTGGGAYVMLSLDLFLRDDASDIATLLDIAVGYELPAGVRLLDLKFELAANNDVTLAVLPLPQPGRIATLQLPSFAGWKLDTGRVAHVPFLGGSFLQGKDLGGNPLDLPFSVTFDASQATASAAPDGRLQLSGLSARITVGTGASPYEINLHNGTLTIDRSLTISRAGAEIVFELRNEVWLFDKDSMPLSIVLAADTKLAIGLDAGAAAVRLLRDDDHPVATAYVPGVEQGKDKQTRFAFSIWKDHATLDSTDVHARITPGGLELAATVKPLPIDLGQVLPGAAIVEGSLIIQQGAYVISAKGTAMLPWLQGASGTLTVVGSSRSSPGTNEVALGVRFDVELDHAWTDPSGILTVEHPGAWVSIKWAAGAWNVDGGVSGKLVFHPPSRGFGEGASDWLHGVFESVAIEFDRLSLRDLSNAARLRDGIALQLRLAHPIVCDLWLLKLSLDSITLRADGIAIGGDVSIHIPTLTLTGRLPSLGIRLDHGAVSLGIDGIGADFFIRGDIVVPSGVSASVEVHRIRRADEEGLFGAGSLVIPGLPGIKIAAELGRLLPQKQPLFMFYVEADIPVVVFPGIVLREEGLGFGYNKVLGGFDTLLTDPTTTGIETLLHGGVPDPGSLDGWENAKDDGTMMLALRSRVASNQAPRDTVQPYVLDIVLGLASDLSLVVFTGGWLFSKLASTDLPEFRKHPAVRGIVGLFPRQRRLEARFTTEKDPKTDIDIPLVTELLSLVRAQVSVVATPDLFQLQLGPITGDASFLGLSVHADALFVVHVGKGAAVAMSHVALNASFNAGVGFDAGMLAVRVSLSARFAYDCTYLGGFADNSLLLYGDTRISAAAALHVELILHIHIHIDLLFGDIDIDIYIHFAASLSIGFDAAVAAVISTHGAGLKGSGGVYVELFGWKLGFDVPFEIGNTGELDRARGLAGQLALQG